MKLPIKTIIEARKKLQKQSRRSWLDYQFRYVHLTRPIIKLGGPLALAETAQSIMDVQRWWP